MTKRAFLEAVTLRVSNVPGCNSFYAVKFALELWENIEKYGEGTAEQMGVPAAAVVSVMTGPRMGEPS